MDPRPFTILIGVDFSESSERALDEAIRIAARTRGRLEVVHVVPSSVQATIELLHNGPRDPDLVDAELRLSECVARALDEPVPVRAHLRMGRPANGLLAAVEQLRPDLVVVGTRGHGAVA